MSEENHKEPPLAAIPLTTFAAEEGLTLKGRYVIEKELGRGGVGVVYLARDREVMSRSVVVKILLERSVQDAWIKTKFRQEIEALSRIDHPGVVGLLDSGETREGLPFLVMQFIEGQSLRAIMPVEGLHFERVANLVSQIAEALAAAHEKGVFHRDLKPENIMIRPIPDNREQVKLIDFGLAKVKDSQVASSTVMPNVAGTFGYMSPEQLMSRPTTAASDVYALGIIAYEMITGRRPFMPESMFELLEMQRGGPRLKPTDLRPALPPAAEQALLKALAYQPADRYPGVIEFANDLRAGLLCETPLPGPRAPLPVTPTLGRRIAAAIPAAADAALLLIILKVSFYRFSDWSSFLAAPPALLLLLLLAAGIAWTAFRATVRRPAVVGQVILAIVLLLFVLRTPDPVQITWVNAPIGAPSDLTLNYSDHRGYHYTIIDSAHAVVRIDPGLYNRLSVYTIQLSLSPDLEFADAYFDRQFNLTEPLPLSPSNTNDVLAVQKKDDNFSRPRTIAFTCKYRTAATERKVQVTLKAGNKTFLYEKTLPL